MKERINKQYPYKADKLRYLYLQAIRYDLFSESDCLYTLSPQAVILLQILKSIPIIFDEVYEGGANTHQENGYTYYKMTSSFLLPHTWMYGIYDRHKISKLIKELRSIKPELIKIYTERVKGRVYTYYAFTSYTRALFNVTNADYEAAKKDQQETDEESLEAAIDQIEDSFSKTDAPEVDDLPQKEIGFVFPDWFDEQWERCKGKFKNCNQYNTKGAVNVYASSFVTAINALCDGTFYETSGQYLKNKSIKVPEGLDPESIVDAILDMPKESYMANPYQAIIFTNGPVATCTKNFSPLLKFFEKQTPSAKKPNENVPVKKGVRSNLTYTKDDYISKKHIKYLWDMEVDQVDHKGETYKGILFGSLPDTWLNTHKYVKKFDTRIDNFFVDICEAYEDTGVKRPPMYKIMDTLEDMARFSCKDNGKKWEEELWGMVASMQVYQDNKLWNWFTEQYERRYGESICKMHQGNKQRAAALVADAEFRELEMTAKALLYGEDD